MAGDWIKMRTDLADDPAVISIARETLIDEYSVVGKLHKVWSWADRHCNADGNAPGVTFLWIDRFVDTEDFGQAMYHVGWLDETEVGVCFPNFSHHNTQTAKERALTAKRVAEHKRKSNASTVTEIVTDTVSDALPTEEKRREEKKGNKKTAFAASDVDVPSHLDSPEVRQALDDWLAYKKTRKQGYAAPEFVALIFKKFKTPGDFVDAVEHAIACNYQGVFAPKQSAQQQPVAQGCQVPTDEELATWSPYG
jgi:hypothetical protein